MTGLRRPPKRRTTYEIRARTCVDEGEACDPYAKSRWGTQVIEHEHLADAEEGLAAMRASGLDLHGRRVDSARLVRVTTTELASWDCRLDDANKKTAAATHRRRR